MDRWCDEDKSKDIKRGRSKKMDSLKGIVSQRKRKRGEKKKKRVM